MTASYDLFITKPLDASRSHLRDMLVARGIEVHSGVSRPGNAENVAPLLADTLDEPTLRFRIQFHHGPDAGTVARAIRESSGEVTADTILDEQFLAIMISLGDALRADGVLALTTAR